MKDDLISRQAAIRWVKIECNPYGNPTLDYDSGIKVIEHLKKMPAAEPELDEWCTDCKEYDHERHYCPRWNRVIRETLKDAENKIVRCKDCKFRYGNACDWADFWLKDDDFCSRGERRTDE